MFKIETNDLIMFRNNITKAYIEGIKWYFQFFKQGISNWRWYYPYAFAPFFSDLDGISILFISIFISFFQLKDVNTLMKPRLEIDEPIKNFEYMMLTIHYSSKQNLPKCY